MPAKPFELPSKSFPSKKAAKKFFSDMLNDYANEQQVKEDEGKLLLELLETQVGDHKSVGGIKYFKRVRNPTFPKWGMFVAVRMDDTQTEFSFNNCVDGKKPSPRDYLYKACHYAISRQFHEFKIQWVKDGKPCAKSGEMLTYDNSHVEHSSPKFSELFDRFIAENSLEIDYSMFPPDSDMQITVGFSDPNLKMKFEEFHRAHATLLVVKTK